MNSKEQNYMVDNHVDIYEDEIDLKELFLVLWRNKIKIISIGLIFAILGLTIGKIKSNKSKQATAIVEYNYPGIEKGETPKGRTFSLTYSEFKNIFMVKEVFEKNPSLITKNLTEDDALAAIKISPVIPKDLKKDEFFYPNKFVFSFKGTDSDKKNEEFLKEFIDVQKESIKNNYDSTKILPTLSNINANNFDYQDLLNIIGSHINSSLTLVRSLEKENINIDEKTRLTIVENNLKTLNNVTLVNLRDTIEDFRIVKSPEDSLVKYRQHIEALEIKKNKSKGKIAQLESMIKSYKPTNKNIVVMNNGSSEKIQTNEENYYTEFLRELAKEKINLSNINVEINYLTKKMNQPFNIKNSDSTTIDKEFSKLIDVFNKNIKDTNKIILENYQRKYSQIVKVIEPVTTESSGKTLLLALAGLILGCGFGCAYVLVANFVYEEKKKKK